MTSSIAKTLYSLSCIGTCAVIDQEYQGKWVDLGVFWTNEH